MKRVCIFLMSFLSILLFGTSSVYADVIWTPSVPELLFFSIPYVSLLLLVLSVLLFLFFYFMKKLGGTFAVAYTRIKGVLYYVVSGAILTISFFIWVLSPIGDSLCSGEPNILLFIIFCLPLLLLWYKIVFVHKNKKYGLFFILSLISIQIIGIISDELRFDCLKGVDFASSDMMHVMHDMEFLVLLSFIIMQIIMSVLALVITFIQKFVQKDNVKRVLGTCSNIIVYLNFYLLYSFPIILYNTDTLLSSFVTSILLSLPLLCTLLVLLSKLCAAMNYKHILIFLCIILLSNIGVYLLKHNLGYELGYPTNIQRIERHETELEPF